MVNTHMQFSVFTSVVFFFFNVKYDILMGKTSFIEQFKQTKFKIKNTLGNECNVVGELS